MGLWELAASEDRGALARQTATRLTTRLFMFVCIVERTFYIFSPEMMNYVPQVPVPRPYPTDYRTAYGAAAPEAPRPRIALR